MQKISAAQNAPQVPQNARRDPGRLPHVNDGNDHVHISPDARASEDDGLNPLLAGMQSNFSTPESGPIELVNHSAPVEKACGDILVACGEALPRDLDLGTTACAVAVGPGVLSGVQTGSLELGGEGLRSAVASLDGLVAQAAAQYGGKLPPKVEQHVALAKAAAARAGMAA